MTLQVNITTHMFSICKKFAKIGENKIYNMYRLNHKNHNFLNAIFSITFIFFSLDFFDNSFTKKREIAVTITVNKLIIQIKLSNSANCFKSKYLIIIG